MSRKRNSRPASAALQAAESRQPVAERLSASPVEPAPVAPDAAEPGAVEPAADAESVDAPIVSMRDLVVSPEAQVIIAALVFFAGEVLLAFVLRHLHDPEMQLAAFGCRAVTFALFGFALFRIAYRALYGKLPDRHSRGRIRVAMIVAGFLVFAASAFRQFGPRATTVSAQDAPPAPHVPTIPVRLIGDEHPLKGTSHGD